MTAWQNLGRVLALAVPLTAFLADARAFAAENRRVSLETRPGVSVDFRFIEPDGATAAVVLIDGGGGAINLAAAGADRYFLSENRDLFAGHGLALALTAPPSDQRDFRGGMHPRFRHSKDHLIDIGAIVAWLKRETHLPVWVIGISRGSVSAAFYAVRGTPAIDGLVLMSSVTKMKSGSSRRSVMELGLEKITVPVFAVAHEFDGCPITPPSGAGKIAAAATSSPKAEAKIFRGGDTGEDPCRARSHHTFLDIEEAVVSAVADFIKANTGKASGPVAARVASEKYLSEAEIRKAVIGNTLTFQAPRSGKTLFVYFAQDGRVAMKVGGMPGRTFTKKWFIEKGAVLCRTFGKDNRSHCAKVADGGDGEMLTLSNKSAGFSYLATVLKGRRLPE